MISVQRCSTAAAQRGRHCTRRVSISMCVRVVEGLMKKRALVETSICGRGCDASQWPPGAGLVQPASGGGGRGPRNPRACARATYRTLSSEAPPFPLPDPLPPPSPRSSAYGTAVALRDLPSVSMHRVPKLSQQTASVASQDPSNATTSGPPRQGTPASLGRATHVSSRPLPTHARGSRQRGVWGGRAGPSPALA